MANFLKSLFVKGVEIDPAGATSDQILSYNGTKFVPVTNSANANLTGDVTSVGNATTLTNAPVIAKVLTGYVSGSGTVAATDSILLAVQKLNGNNALKANIASPTFTSTVAVTGGALGTTAGNELTVSTISSTNANTDNVRTKYRRVSGGADWTSAQAKIQRTIDGTDMGYVAFGGTSAYDVRIGSGTTDIAVFASTGVDIVGNIALTGSVVFEGATADGFETTLSVTDPTADRTITLPNASGTVALTNATTLSSLTTVGTLGYLGVTGNLNVNTNTLFVDATSNRVGIGTDTPGYELDVNGSVSVSSNFYAEGTVTLGNGLVFANAATGKVGIMNGSPSYTLDVYHSNSNAWGAMRVLNDGGGYSFLVEDMSGGDTTPFVIASDGKTGIGTATPVVALDVIGTISARTAVTQDGVALAGRTGGTGTFKSTLTPTTLTADRTLTLPDTSGTLAVAFNNASVSTVSAAYATETYLAGSSVAIPAGGWTAKTTYRCVFDMVKTAAGTGAFTIYIRLGNYGSTSTDPYITNATLTFGAGTAVADTSRFEVLVNFRTVGAGTSAVIRATASCNHSLAATGLISTGASGFGQVGATSSGFDSTTQTILGISVVGGTSFSGTNNFVQAELKLA